MRRFFTAAVLVLMVCTALPAWDSLNLDLQLELATIGSARAPELWYRTVVLTFDKVKYARYVGAAFSFENFQVIHPYKRNEKGVFVLPYNIPEGIVTYRIVVDGLWMPDPTNPKTVRDSSGNTLSKLDIDLPPQRLYLSPQVGRTGEVVFTVRHAPDKRVFLSGDFNNWEPFMFEMTEVSPGVYTFTKQFRPGRFEYCYIADGSRMLDPLNPDFGTDSHGYLASRFVVPL